MQPEDLLQWATMGFSAIVILAMGLYTAKFILGIGDKPPACSCQKEEGTVQPTP
jgi:hypothetical protein